MSDWISVDKELPEQMSEVLVFCKYDNWPLIAFHTGKTWYEKCDNIVMLSGDAHLSTEIHDLDIGDVGYQITHWMPLPEPPKES